MGLGRAHGGAGPRAARKRGKRGTGELGPGKEMALTCGSGRSVGGACLRAERGQRAGASRPSGEKVGPRRREGVAGPRVGSGREGKSGLLGFLGRVWLACWVWIPFLISFLFYNSTSNKV